MIKTSIVWDFRKRTASGKEGPLEVRICIDRKNYYVNTGIKVRKSEWKHGEIVNRDDSGTLMSRLNIIYKRIEDEINAVMEGGGAIDVADIKRKAWASRVDNESTAFLDWLAEQAERLTHVEGTVKHYRTMIRRLTEFGQIRRWSDVTAENIWAWDSWLHQLEKPQSDADRKAGRPVERISDAAVYNYHKCLKAMLNRAVMFDRIQVNPYARMRGKFRRGERERVDFLTDDEIDAFMSLHPLAGSDMAVSRDLFVFQMFTGMAFSDMQSFSIDDYKSVGGRMVNTGERLKTGVAYISQLLPPVTEVLEKYNYQLPKIVNSKYNYCLKALGMACGIERPLHSHMARHTFATYMLRHGVRIEHVSKMLGHTNITQTQRYAKIVAADIHDDFDRIAKNMNKKKDKGR